MSVSFHIQFYKHLPEQWVSHLKGILLSQGTYGEGVDTFVLDVHREKRASHTAITLNNWVAYGWVLSWKSEPPLVQD